MPGGGDVRLPPPAFFDVRPEARCVFEHLSEVQLRELPIDHALEDVRRELELPNPPGRPPHPGLVLSSHSPVWSPALISIPSGPTPSRMAQAQRMARAGPSKVARKPSPVVLTSRPRKRVSSRRTSA